jgi:hypothetical protein
MPAIKDDAALLNDYPEQLDGEDAFVNAVLEDEDDKGDPEEGNDAPVKRKPSKKPAEEEDDTEQANDDDEDAEDNSDESPEEDESDDEDGEDDKDAAKKKFADDDDETYVKVKEGDTEHEVKVSDLKRLWGQEAALTRKSQEVATERKAIETKRAENIAAYDVLLKRATERADQYRALPWTQLMKDQNVPADQLQALQAEASKALEEETFLKSELGNFMQKVQTEQAEARRSAAQECLKEIKNPESPAFIKGWNDALYNDIRAFGNEMGIPSETLNEITDAGAVKILHMAMQFHRGAKKVVVTKKVNKTPAKIVKNSASSPAQRGPQSQVTVKAAVNKVKRTGSLEDAANAFEAMMGDD